MQFIYDITDPVVVIALSRAAASYNNQNATSLTDTEYLALITKQNLDAMVHIHTVNSLTKYEFLARFTQDERVLIRATAATNGQLYDFMQMLEVSEEIHLDNPDTMAGVNFLESVGLIDPGRAAEILAR